MRVKLATLRLVGATNTAGLGVESSNLSLFLILALDHLLHFDSFFFNYIFPDDDCQITRC